ncbi:MAG TPA: BTAD domain-containing putative transcriptional regulator [Mycobacteriales bacterium]|nr:BTAD domain-containing putative transcriptional regulator [Mycobacteriales bacterium]
MDSSARRRPAGLDALVREFRQRTGLTQQEAADLAGMSVAALRDLEQARVSSPRRATLRRLAAALELSPAEAERLQAGAQEQTPAEQLRIEVLGPLAVTVDGEPVDLGSPTRRTLLGLLALFSNTPVSRDALVEAAWGERPAATSADLLQTHISRLRRRLAPAAGNGSAPQPLVATSGGYQLTATDGQLDLLAFRQALTAARRARAAGDLVAAAQGYGQAAALWRGDPLADVDALRSHPAVVALTRQWQAMVVEYAEVAEPIGRHEQVLPLLERVVEADPLHEAAHARLIVALAGTGQQAAALDRYERLRHRLADELGADPGRELADAHQRVLRQEVSRPASAPTTAYRQLPPDIAEFTGRSAELAVLADQLPAPGEPAGAIVISAIEGMAGVGKTRLAVHLAHRLIAAGRYTDAQLYVDLRGYADEPPADPATVLASFLHLLGVPGAQIPPDLDSRAALYRDRLHDRNALVLLDNAGSEAQVRPLLPAGPGNLVLVTSRRALALDGAAGLVLDLFTPGEAAALLTQIVGTARVAAEPDGAGGVVELCGRLPLAIALAARRLRARPSWRLADLAARLADDGSRLVELAAGTRQLRAVFDLSYQALDPAAQRLFRLLGLYVGDDMAADSVAALAAVPPAEARELLDRLVDEHLLTVVPGDRYGLHDLVRGYARQIAAAAEAPADREAAVTRLLDFYLHTTDRATRLVQPNQRGVELIGTPPAHPPRLETLADAEQWLQGERGSLGAAVTQAAGLGRPGHAWRLGVSLAHYLYQYGFPEEWERVYAAGLAAAQATADIDGEVAIRWYQMWMYLTQHRTEEAMEHLVASLELHRRAGDRTQETSTLVNLSAAHLRLGRFAPALDFAMQGLAVLAGGVAGGGDPFREAALRGNAADALISLGRIEEALATCRPAVQLSRQCNDGQLESGILALLGVALLLSGQPDEAIDHLQRALAVAIENGRPAEALVRQELGRAYAKLGRWDEARAELTEVLDLVRDMRQATMGEHDVVAGLAAVYREAGELDTARELLERGLPMAIAVRERYHQARILEGLALVEERAGRMAAACQHRHSAEAIFSELEVPEADRIRQRL